MSKKNKNKNKDVFISDEFFWEIPGDVPGKSAQDDPFQSDRATLNPDYKATPKSLIKKITTKKPKPSLVNHQINSTSKQESKPIYSKSEFVTENASTPVKAKTANEIIKPKATINVIATGADKPAPLSDSTDNQHNHQRFKWSPRLILLLLIIGLGGTIYHYLFDSSNTLSEASRIGAIPVVESTPIAAPLPITTLKKATIDTAEQSATEIIVSKQPKVIETIQPEKDLLTKTQTLRIISHTVVKGDTLWDISKTYVNNPFHYPVLAKINNIKNPDLIYPGEVVQIHVYE